MVILLKERLFLKIMLENNLVIWLILLELIILFLLVLFHQYQRTDTIWAQEHTVPIDLYKNGIDKSHNFIDAFAFINCENDEIKKIEPKKLEIQLKKPEFFGDNWSDRLDKKEFEEVKNYFQEKKDYKKYLVL